MSEVFVNRHFQSKVAIAGPDECWEWKAGKNRGYGAYWDALQRKQRVATRVVFEWFHNRKIGAGLVIRHSCDNKGCVNPQHLIEGTNADNSQDMVSRGRAPTKDNGKHWHLRSPEKINRGSRVGTSKLTWEQVREIRRLREQGYSLYKIADRFPVTAQCICYICRGVTWKEETITGGRAS